MGGAGMCLRPALRLHIEFGQVASNPPHSRVVEARGLERRLKGQGKEALAQEALDGQ